MFNFIGGFGRATTVVQALGLYVLSYHIVPSVTAGARQAATVAVLSAVVAAISVSVNVYSYVRYYAVGPIFPKTLLYFCCVLLHLELFQNRSLTPVRGAVLALLCLVMYLVHDQEAALFYAFLLALSVVTVAHYLASSRGSLVHRQPLAPDLPFRDRVGIGGVRAVPG